MKDTEKRGSARPLDTLSALEILRAMNEEDRKVAAAVEATLPRLAEVVESVVEKVGEGGRVIFVGAGTSGRLGVLEAVECPPTFGLSPGTLVGVIAGGEEALVRDREGVEDDAEAGRHAMVERGVSGADLVVGVSASGSTPYTLAALREAGERGGRTVCVVNVRGSEMARVADVAVEILTGAEVLAGSTRLRAATAQKMALNMISTAAMSRLGYVYENLMVGVLPHNAKLVERAGRIIHEATGCGEEKAAEALARAENDVRCAILLADGVKNIEEARRRLERAGGSLREARAGSREEDPDER